MSYFDTLKDQVRNKPEEQVESEAKDLLLAQHSQAAGVIAQKEQELEQARQAFAVLEQTVQEITPAPEPTPEVAPEPQG